MQITIQKAQSSRIDLVDFDNIQFGKIFSDHQFIVDFDGKEWVNARIVPYGELMMSPAISAIHYGQAIFEGMKAYKDPQGQPQLFRPLENLKRLNMSARRMAMPEMPEALFSKALTDLIGIDRNWIPTKEGSALYLRPFMFATDDFIGVRPSDTYRFIIFSCPVNAYYQNALKVKVEDTYIRGAEGGVGGAKCAGNYGSVMLPTREAQQQGYSQVLWTDAREHKYLEETGTTNIFVRIGDTLITPSTAKGTILAGITRDSILQLARSKGIAVEERAISIDEVVAAYKNGTLKEVFASGTAATIAKIELIHYQDTDIAFNDLDKWEYCNELMTQLDNIKTGKAPDEFSWMVKID